MDQRRDRFRPNLEQAICDWVRKQCRICPCTCCCYGNMGGGDRRGMRGHVEDIGDRIRLRRACHGACLADSGNDVVCVDIDKAKIDLLLAGGVPIFEPGLAELIARSRENGLIDFTTDKQRGIEHGDVIFIAVPTPMGESGAADLSHVFSAAADIGSYMDRYKVVVDKSTVPVGTADKVRAIIRTKTTHEFDVVSNPEFLKQGKAIADFMQPDRVVIGSDSERALKVMEDLYEPFLRTFHPLIAIDVKSAEMAKYAANCFLATKISFINEMSNLCEKAGLTFRRCERPSELTSASAMIFCSPG